MRSVEFVNGHELYREFLDSEFYKENMDLFQLLVAAAHFIRSKNLEPQVRRVALRKLTSKLRPEMHENQFEILFRTILTT